MPPSSPTKSHFWGGVSPHLAHLGQNWKKLRCLSAAYGAIPGAIGLLRPSTADLPIACLSVVLWRQGLSSAAAHVTAAEPNCSAGFFWIGHSHLRWTLPAGLFFQGSLCRGCTDATGSMTNLGIER